MNISIGCIIVTYNPDEQRLKESINSVLKQCNQILIIDNKSSNIEQIKQIIWHTSNIELIELDHNYGIAKALNVGMDKFRENPMDWILMLDQDTLILCDIRSIVLKANYKTGIIQMSNIAINSKNLFFINNVPIIISGSIINGKIIPIGLKFREEFFLDHVDTDFDFQIRKLGFAILRTAQKCMDHEWGVKVLIGRNKTKYTTNLRVYLTVRNGTRLILEKKLSPSIYLSDNCFYIFYNLKKHKNVFSIILIVIGGVSDGIFDVFSFKKKFEKLLKI